MLGIHCARSGTSCGLFYDVTNIEGVWDDVEEWTSNMARSWHPCRVPDGGMILHVSEGEMRRGVQAGVLGLGKADCLRIACGGHRA